MKYLKMMKKGSLLFLGLLMIFTFILGSRMPKVIGTFRAGYDYNQLEKQLYKTYSVLNDSFQFKLPESWGTWNETFEGGEIIYHLYFNDASSKIFGFIQAWQIDKPLKTFVEESKNAATGVVDFKSYQVKEMMVNGKLGYLIEYVRKNDKGEYFVGYEGFVQGDDKKIYRASFFVNEKNWKDYYRVLFNRIIQSFQIK